MSEMVTNDAVPWWLKPWPAFSSWAPQNLTQPINPGWTFGNLIVNEVNSSAPDTERQILAMDSYGRQIGKLLDAVHALIEAQGGPGKVAAYQDVFKLRASVEQIKCKAADRRVDQFGRDLELLKTADAASYHRKVKQIRGFFAEPWQAGQPTSQR